MTTCTIARLNTSIKSLGSKKHVTIKVGNTFMVPSQGRWESQVWGTRALWAPKKDSCLRHLSVLGSLKSLRYWKMRQKDKGKTYWTSWTRKIWESITYLGLVPSIIVRQPFRILMLLIRLLLRLVKVALKTFARLQARVARLDSKSTKLCCRNLRQKMILNIVTHSKTSVIKSWEKNSTDLA